MENKSSVVSNKSYKYGTYALSALLTAKPVQLMTTKNILVESKQWQKSVQLDRNLVLVPPSISTVDIGDMELSASIIKITGMYFGAVAPKI